MYAYPINHCQPPRVKPRKRQKTAVSILFLLFFDNFLLIYLAISENSYTFAISKNDNRLLLNDNKQENITNKVTNP